MTSVDHVFQFSQTQGGDNNAPPALVAPGGSKGGVVNVVEQFYWTYSPKGNRAREEVPELRLVEKELKTNALIAQLLYSGGAAIDGFTNIATQLVGSDTVDSFNQAVKQILSEGKKIVDKTETGQKLGAQAQQFYDNIRDENPTFNDTRNSWLQPYKNLYLTKDTGWQFRLPYFENFAAAAQNAFSGEGGPGGFLGALGGLKEIATSVADAIAVGQDIKGVTYVERSKFFNYPTDGEEFTFTFPLINTGSATYDDVIKNWQLTFLLLYNNRPARKNASVIEQPKVYEVYIPGVKYMPFAYIQSLQIDFQGARRQMKIPLPPGANSRTNTLVNSYTYDAIIPDAYMIKISLKGLIAESKNFMFHMLNPSGPIQVMDKNGVADNGSSLLDQFKDQLNIMNAPGTIEVVGNTASSGATNLLDQFLNSGIQRGIGSQI